MSDNEDPQTQSTDSVEKNDDTKHLEPISFTGTLSKDKENLVVMNWVLSGFKEDLYEHVGKEVTVTGVPSKNTLLVKKVVVRSEHSDKSEDISLYGKVTLKKGVVSLKGHVLTSDVSLAAFEGYEVFVSGRKSQDGTVRVQHIDVTEVIKGTLVSASEFKEDRHYLLNDYEIHSEKDLDSYLDEEVEMVVVPRMHGTYMSDKHVTFVQMK